MRIALLSNVTVGVLAGLLREGHEVWTPPGFGGWMETALNPPADLVAFSPDTIAVLLDARFNPAPDAEALAAAGAALSAAFPAAAVVAPDLDAHFADLGEAAYDERMWTLARMPWSMEALRTLLRLLTPVKKVLALDLDNTLWSGVVSEDGSAGIVPDAALQEEAAALKARGVLLVALSKNDADDVASAWKNPTQRLGPDDFAAMRVDWEAKSANLMDVARELNLSPDAFVFVDDNAGNRAEMRAGCPDVAVAPFPPRLSDFFPGRAVTAEDRLRAADCRAEAQRRAASVGLSFDDYLASLRIETDIRPLAADDIPRVAQLAARSNQFNVCTNRLSSDEFRRIASDPAQLVLTLRVRDRFADQGLVAYVRASVDGDVAEILDWTMSCRAMNRRVEFALQESLERTLRERGVRRLGAIWRRTAKNAPVERLFDAFGFDCTASGPDERRYVKDLRSGM